MLERDLALVRDLERVLAPERVLSRPIDRVARSVDASIYRMIPQVVVRPRDLDEIRALFAYARAHRRHLTLRTAGTSLSGQAVTDDILVELAPFWQAYRVLDEGRRLWSQPGVVGGYLNRVLAPHRRRLGPDPASIDACMIGGIVANNSSGMCCGVAQNSYHTLDAMHLLLADGTELDTARPEADEDLRRARPDLHAALLALRDEVRADAVLAARIRAKFARKQTMAYALNALLDHDTPVQILAHLMVGSQGTLGFVADVTLRTVPEPPHRAAALLYFEELAEAGAAVAPLVAAGAAALEIMDAASLRSQAGDREYPFTIGARTAALLAEFRAD
ncbi:MAG TPA: FAD-binding oxidoreductase, partial [Vicinamibacteria bacterium]|nr:FAD-binding oxidoreductase [Vicinamibacteria bacterium]